MKTILLILLAISLSIAVKAQQVDTTRKVLPTQAEIWIMHNQVLSAYSSIHKLDIPALKRDHIDSLLSPIINLIENKYFKEVEDEKKKALIKKP